MNRYVFLRRIRGPVMIVVFGVTALLNQWDVMSFGKSWPLYLIALGVLMLAERAAWAQAQSEIPLPGAYAGAPPQGYPGQYPDQRGGWSETTGPTSPAPNATPPDMPQGANGEGR
ncbi:MAG TPA: DUF5668 domain-containing protein [Acidobacteriaceae bacterium]|nr:DUF5668 domain-containing protein [Acidobacteriaceae bacterium]